MLTHPTHDRLIALGLAGMAKALEDQRRQPDVATLPFEERLAMMIDREAIDRENKRLERRLKVASLRQSAIVEDNRIFANPSTISSTAADTLGKHSPTNPGRLCPLGTAMLT